MPKRIQFANEAELTESVERFRASMAAYQGSLDTGARIVEKGRTLLVVKGERAELRRFVSDHFSARGRVR